MHSKILVYTFRSFPYLKELKQIFSEVIVLDKIKSDLGSIYDFILKQNPNLILGVALSKNRSVFEPIAVNKFNKKSKVIKNGDDYLKLSLPNFENTNFSISKSPSSSFCNYSVYKIQNFLNQNKLNILFMFSHLQKENIVNLSKILNLK